MKSTFVPGISKHHRTDHDARERWEDARATSAWKQHGSSDAPCKPVMRCRGGKRVAYHTAEKAKRLLVEMMKQFEV